MDMCVWGKKERDKISLKWFPALKIYCYEDLSYMINGIYRHDLPKNQWGTSSTLLMLTSFLKLLSHLCQKRFSPGNHKRATEVSFCNRPVCTQWQEPPLISWRLSGCHIDLGKPSTLALTNSTNFQKQSGNISSKVYLLGGVISFLDWVMKQHLFWMEKQISTLPKPHLLPGKTDILPTSFIPD